MTDGASTVLRVLHRHQHPRCRQVLAPQRVSPHPPPERVSSDEEDEAAPSAALAAMELDAPPTPPPRAPPPLGRDHTDDGLFSILPSEIILMIIKYICVFPDVEVGGREYSVSSITLSRAAASCRTLRWAVRCVFDDRDGTAHYRRCWQAMKDALPKHWSREWRLPPPLAISSCEGKDADQLLKAMQQLAPRAWREEARRRGEVAGSPSPSARVASVLLRTAGHAERRAGTLSATATLLDPPAGLHRRLYCYFSEPLYWRAVQALAECWVSAALPPECSRIAKMFCSMVLTLNPRPRVTAWHVRLYAARNGRTPRTMPLYEVLLLHAPNFGPVVSPAGQSHAFALILCPGRCGKDVDSTEAINAAYRLPPGRLEHLQSISPPRTRWRRLLHQFKRREGWGSLWEL